MPVYDFICTECAVTAGRVAVVEVDCAMKDRSQPRYCGCGNRLTRIYGPLPHYWCGCEWPGGYRPAGEGDSG